MNKVIILSRVSTETQDLSQQTQEILNQVHKDGYTDNKIVFIEDKESGVKLDENERHGIKKLKGYIESDKTIKSVYIYELSRLSRRTKVLFSLRDYLLKNNVQLICLKPNFRLLDEDGKITLRSSLIFSIYSSLSESETLVLKERFKRGRKYKQLQGLYCGIVPLFGYSINEEKQYIIHPEESKILQRIFNEYTHKNKSLRSISKELKDEGLFPNTSLSTLYSDIQKWTKNEKYLGKSYYPQIISNEVFYQCQELRDKHKKPIKGISKDFLLNGLIIDIDINKSMIPKKLKGRLKQREQYSSEDHSSGIGHSITKDKIDPIVWYESVKLYKEYIINKDRLIKGLEKRLEFIRKEIDKTIKEKTLLLEQIDNVEERLIFGKISRNRCENITRNLTLETGYKDNYIEELKQELKNKERTITDITSSKEIDFETLSIPKKKEIINKVIDIISFKRIDLHKCIIRIYNKCNDKVIEYQIDGKSKVSGFKTRETIIKPKEKPIKNDGPKTRIGYTYNGQRYTTSNKLIS